MSQHSIETLYVELTHIRESLKRLEAANAELLAQQKITNSRVTALEKWKYGLLVGLATLAATRWPAIQPVIKGVFMTH